MIYFIVFLISFITMEFIAFLAHKFVMHGFMWYWHKDHHRKDYTGHLPKNTEEKKLEKNDIFFLIFATPAITLFILGITTYNLIFISIASGITFYGIIYFTFHDIIIHNRLNNSIFNKTNNRYIKAMIEAHKAHHNAKSREDFENFGLLIFNKKYFDNN